ncbi:MAG: DUF1553 domain-containing protein [Planctomycetaceae bacterium]|nr:DUF1553 domain-containing protein [Planctomycetaceae bacterium]
MFDSRWLLVAWLAIFDGGWPGPASANDELSFDRQILPLLTKAGCNAGSCHGAAAGRGDFHLSLFGADPAADHRAIASEFSGRRINPLRPERSLLIRKPTGDLEHGGDVLFDSDGPETLMIKDWIKRGAPRPVTAPLQRLSANETDAFFSSVPAKTRFEVEAQFLDGTRQVVTDYVTWISTDTSAIRVDSNGEVELQQAGQHVLLARYMNQVIPIQLSAPLGDALPNEAWQSAKNPIDREILKRLDRLRIPPSPLAEDAQWLRRVHLDLTGRLPTSTIVVETLQQMGAGSRDRVRAEVVERLLHSPDYANYWTWRLASELRLKSLGDTDRSLETYYNWLHQVIIDDSGFDQMARALLTSLGDSQTVGPANFGRMVRDAREHAELVAQFFAGTRLGCANCHDHPLDRWTQDDYHGLAAVFAKLQRGQIVQLAARGEVTNLRTLAPAVPRIPGLRDLEFEGDQRHHIADWVLDAERDLFAKVTVNRVWQAMFGRGLVEPVDDMRATNPASHPELLNALARDFAANGFRLRHTLRLIALSDTYARSKLVLPGNERDDRFYSHAYKRPLEAALLFDALRDAWGVYEANSLFKQRAVHFVNSDGEAPILDVLGRCPEGLSCERNHDGSLGLAAQLLLLNGDIFNGWLTTPEGRLGKQFLAGKTIEEIIAEWYLVALSRPASEAELEYWGRELVDDNHAKQRQRVEDFVWSLLNSREFRER